MAINARTSVATGPIVVGVRRGSRFGFRLISSSTNLGIFGSKIGCWNNALRVDNNTSVANASSAHRQ